MKTIMLVLLGAGLALTVVPSAQAEGGCGIRFHRGPRGACYPNGGPVLVGPEGPAYGVFYPGRGYWDGHRYWGHRYPWHGGWRYR